MPEASIIIRAFNEAKHLPGLFDGLAEQTYRDFETVVVDSGSFDLTQEIARQRADQLVTIKSEDFTFGHSLNVGIKHSHGEFIAIVSAHTLPTTSSWLERLIAPLREELTAMVYGRQLGPSGSKVSECWDFERTFGTEPRIMKPPHFFANNANSAVQRKLWLEHPFDETLPGLEDIEWAKYWMNRGYRVAYEPEACIFHVHSETWEQVRRRYYREGQAAKWIGIRHRRDIPREIWRETRFFFGDLGKALRGRQLGKKGAEIARFRYEKLTGTLVGIYDGALMENPLERDKLFFDRHYEAVVIHGPGRASLDTMELPQLKPSEVLVRVAYQAVCATDLEILDGTLGYYKNGLAQYPIVPGHEFSGTVAAVGPRVTNVKVGDGVVVECIQGCGECAACQKDNGIGCVERREVGVIWRNGGYSEYMITPARFVHPLADAASLKEACLCEPIAVVLKGLGRMERTLGGEIRSRACAVVGGGPIGHLAARILTLRGHQVTVFDRDQRRLNYFAGSSIRTAQDLHELASFEVIIEATGDADALSAILNNSAAGATLLLLGLPYAQREFSFETIVGYDKTIVGSVGSSATDFAAAVDLLSQIDTKAFMERTLPLAEFEQAWEISRQRRYLKVILQIDSSIDDVTA
jgi:2-desacetyl-2-hydroxyethyl bacteriochlorophyllide A dehydrogenase